MHIDETTHDDLKAYLAKELAEIADADPGMLADYVIALLKHDKEKDDLRALCISQLEDFLPKQADAFVDTLFKALDTKSYMQSHDAKSRHEADPTPTSPPSAHPASERNAGFEDIPTGPAAERHRDDGSSHGHMEKHRRGDSDGSDDEDRSYKHARRDDDRDHRRRDYSPSRPSDDDRHGSRRRGSADHGNGAPDHGYERRGDRHTRQQGLTTAGFNNRNNVNNFNNNSMGSNQNAFDNNGVDRGQWNGPQQNRGRFEGSQRGGFQDQRGNSDAWRGGSNMRGGRGGMHDTGSGFGQDRPKRQRCRDYDEKGYCMRGDLCPYDHGVDRIVVDDLPRFDMMGGAPAMGPNGMMGMAGGRPPFFPGGPTGGMIPNPSDVYDPEAAALSANEIGLPRQGIEDMEGGHRRGGQEMGGRGGMRGRGSLRGMRGRGRSGASHPYSAPGHFPGAGPGTAGSKTSLVVEHIPDEHNTIDKVNEFFKKFGSLTNIQVDQSAHKALIQYSTREEAGAAYNSPDVIFGNRFVKVYWQPDDLDASTFGRQPKPTGQVRPEKGPGGGAPHHGHPAVPKPPVSSVLMTPERAAELAAERAAAAAKLQESKKAMQEIQRQKEALIQRQQEEQKLLLQKMFANKNMSQQDKDEILKGLKNVAIEVTKEPVDPHAQARAAAVAAEAQRQADLQKEAERRERERLDRELETLNTVPVKASGTGADSAATTIPSSGTSPDAVETTAALKAKLAALQAQAAALGLESQGGYAGRGRGGYIPRGRGRGAPVNMWTRGGGRGGAMGSHNRTFRLDNRSTKLSVSNIDEASKGGLKEHFESYGELESFTLGPDGTSATVQYKIRKDAETAMQQGSQVPNATTSLKLAWISEPPAAPVPTAPASKTLAPQTTPTLSATGPTTNASSVSVAAYESEEDEDGERSWKR
ncbi:hypothetical protein BC939DRAFT_445349 [Gamsiella multidivaricata]|uniref:uncharacterized protein n=1 Tax=Gamsiella multidivaricata TaxID=101098 RepID=UPI0022209B52|nr:uncharacterized protein BC939DRAFT_445349 [Gamsiella multidivaricata]KAG0367957.1 hypothetical protein BGZ54_002946 [Gamsiella multidivaricata]KAI7827468.1 hypothetical protein BC939DRAFT_445349 [Gamsiella multidivaricata]